MKSFLSFLWETAKIFIIALVIVVPIRYFLFQPFFVKGASMDPNFADGQYLIIDEISYRFQEPARGEVVVFKYPYDTSQRYIKRIIGLPGEDIKIKDGKVFIADKVLDESAYLSADTVTAGSLEITLGSNEYFVMGDNRLASSDSRRWGPVSRENIIGRVALRAWPFATLTQFEHPALSNQ